MDDLGGKPHHLWKHPFAATPAENHARAVFLPKKSEHLKRDLGPLEKKVVHISMNFVLQCECRPVDFCLMELQEHHNVTIPFAGKFQFKNDHFPPNKTAFLVMFKGDKINRTLQTLAFSIAASMSRDLRDGISSR